MNTGLQYIGNPGSTHDCVQAVVCVLHSRCLISKALILSNGGHHCLLLTKDDGDEIAVKSGFSSGYGGTGPAGFSRILCLLDQGGADLDEIDVSQEIIDRVDRSALSNQNMKTIRSANAVRPTRLWDYVRESDYDSKDSGALWRACCKPMLPLSIIDDRIFDLALYFWNDTDRNLMVGFRRFEDLVRKRTGIEEIGTKLISAAFQGKNPRLTWGKEEQEGRALILVGAIMAYRNARAHKEIRQTEHDALREFLLLNEMFHLERSASDVI